MATARLMSCVKCVLLGVPCVDIDRCRCSRYLRYLYRFMFYSSDKLDAAKASSFIHSFICSEWQAVWEAATICPRPLQVDLWPFDLEWCPSHVWRGLVCANFSLPVLDLGPMYAIYRRQTRIIALPLPRGGGIIKQCITQCVRQQGSKRTLTAAL